MAKVAELIGDKAGDLVEGMFKKALGVKETDEDKDKGFFGSFFGGDKKKDADDDKGSFFSKVFDRDDDDDDRKAKSSGFQGLFTELENPEPGAGPGPGVAAGRGTSDGDLFADLMEVAEETSQGK